MGLLHGCMLVSEPPGLLLDVIRARRDGGVGVPRRAQREVYPSRSLAVDLAHEPVVLSAAPGPGASADEPPFCVLVDEDVLARRFARKLWDSSVSLEFVHGSRSVHRGTRRCVLVAWARRRVHGNNTPPVLLKHEHATVCAKHAPGKTRKRRPWGWVWKIRQVRA